MSIAEKPPQTPAQPQELNEFLLELALALQRYAMYPGGHPSVDAAVNRLNDRLDTLLMTREVLSLGIARKQIVTEGIATPVTHPVLRSLSQRLHRHRLGAVVFRRGLGAEELHDALLAVAADPDREGGEPIGGATAEKLATWPHVRFYRITYEQLQLSEDGDEDDYEDDDGSPQNATGRGTVAAELWVGLARAAIARGESVDADQAAAFAQPDEVADAINHNAGEKAYDQAITGYLLQLAEELKREGGKTTKVVRRRVSHVISRLDHGTLARLLEMGGDTRQRGRFLHGAVSGLRPDAVLEVARAAARTQGQSISTSLMRLLRKLSIYSEGEAVVSSTRAELELRDQVHLLLNDWKLEDPNPEAYTIALEQMARFAHNDEMDTSDALHAPEPLRMVQMGIEVASAGPVFWRAVDALVSEHRLHELFEVLDGTEPGNPIADLLWHFLETRDHIRLILTTDPVDFESLDRIFERLPASSVISLLLDRLSESASRTTRMGVFRRLAGRGLPAVPQVMARLNDTRWFVLRNMLSLIGEIGSFPPGFSPLQYAQHSSVMLRREALLVATKIPSERERAIGMALVDRDERIVRVGLNAARETGFPEDALRTVLRRLDEPQISPELFSALVRPLSRHATEPVIDRLLGFVIQGRTLLGRPKLAPKTVESLAALGALCGMTTDDARVQAALQLARASSDSDIKAAATAGKRK